MDPQAVADSTGGDMDAAPDATVDLLARARAGDAHAREALFARYLGPLGRWASGRLPQWARDGADTQDFVQETLLSTFRNIERFEPRGSGAFYGYLREAVMNRIRNELRRAARRGERAEIDPNLVDDATSPLERAIGRQATERYERALQRLRPIEREALVARIELGCSYEEVAAILEKPTPEAARKAVRRAFIRLAEEMTHVDAR